MPKNDKQKGNAKKRRLKQGKQESRKSEKRVGEDANFLKDSN